MQKIIKLLLLIYLLIVSSVFAEDKTTGNLITNGNFETGNSTGWTTSGDVQVLTDCCELNNVTSTRDLEFGDSGSITQDFNLTSNVITQAMLDTNGVTLNSTVEVQNGECAVSGCWGGSGPLDTFTITLKIKDSDGATLATVTQVRTDVTGINGANFTNTVIHNGSGSNVGNIFIKGEDGNAPGTLGGPNVDNISVTMNYNDKIFELSTEEEEALESTENITTVELEEIFKAEEIFEKVAEVITAEIAVEEKFEILEKVFEEVSMTFIEEETFEEKFEVKEEPIEIIEEKEEKILIVEEKEKEFFEEEVKEEAFEVVEEPTEMIEEENEPETLSVVSKEETINEEKKEEKEEEVKEEKIETAKEEESEEKKEVAEKKEESNSEESKTAEISTKDKTKQKIVQKKEVKTGTDTSVSVDKIDIDKVNVKVVKLTLFNSQPTLNSYENIAFYKDEQLYKDDINADFFEQLSLDVYNKDIYTNVRLTKYIQNDPIKKHNEKMDDIKWRKQKILLDLEQLKWIN